MKNFLAVIGGIVVGFFVLMIVVFAFNDINTPGGIQLFNSNPPRYSSPRTMTATEIAEKLDNAMETTMPGTYRSELDRENDLYKVDMWNSFTRDNIETMQSGLGLDRWTQVRQDLTDMCADMQSRFTDNGHPEVTVVLSLVDPEDPDYVFATAARGVVGYDIVSGIDLMAEKEG